MVIDFLVLSAPVAVAFTLIYLVELRVFLARLRSELPEAWRDMGSPTPGRASRSVVIPLVLGELKQFALLSSTQRARARRLRAYVTVLFPYYIVWFLLVLFRRELGLIG
ncbi:hypothetical protein [Stenotrophomonas sp.]|uniref:hypothetical protein n=1 Tax=Stenotrophomonas sp. TaxID=69392 RepID=UPI0028AEAAF5|nr:hypothetical protein [Stenotrophomonas sp.]